RVEMAKDRAPASRLMSAMAQLDCGACGYVCKTYAEAIASGKEKDLTRCTPGGRETNKALKELLKVLPSDGAVSAAAKPSAKSTTDHAPKSHGRDNPFPARLVQS